MTSAAGLIQAVDPPLTPVVLWRRRGLFSRWSWRLAVRSREDRRIWPLSSRICDWGSGMCQKAVIPSGSTGMVGEG